MWRLIVPIVLCFYTASSASVENLSHLVCKNATIGDVVANPRDCNSYFICGTIPLISYCDFGLHFNANDKVCHFPDIAKCKVSQVNTAPVHDAEVLITDLPMPNITTVLNTEREHVEKRVPIELPTKRPPLFFKALDVNTHKPIDPMTNYDPENIACYHYGAYFLPHPTDCTAYYVCAFGHILQHKCGRGAGWSYMRQMCEIGPLVECYTEASFPTSTAKATTEPEALTELSYGKLIDNPPNTGEYTVCYILTNGIAGPLIWASQTTTDISSSPTESTHNPSTLATASSTGRANTALLDVLSCPKNVEAYLPHSMDCSKYYICIIGMPVLTSCPEGLYWDQNAEVCNLSAKVNCLQKKSN